MSNNNSASQRLRRNGSPSTSKSSGPLRATIPVSFMSQNVIHDVPEDKVTSSQNARNKISPSPAAGKSSTLQYGRSRQSPWRLRQLSPTPKVENTETLPSVETPPAAIRRTASLDAIYLKGQWPRGLANLPVDKATQTPEEWIEDKRLRGLEASPSRDRKQKQRIIFLNPPVIQPGSVSPSRVAASTNTDRKEISRAIPMPSSQSSRARNSVEGFNTEIEKLVWRDNKMMEPTPDGHRAPIAELFKNNSFRSVDTQTPVTNSSSGTSSPVSPFIWGVFDQSSRPGTAEEYNSLSPEDFQAMSLGTSPRGRFLCREPPDGCERVETLKVAENAIRLYGPPKPSAQFEPSSGSAFCSLTVPVQTSPS